MRFKVTVAKGRPGQIGQRLCLAGALRQWRLAVVLDEIDDIDRRRDRYQSLPEAHEQVIDLGGFRFGLGHGYLADGEGVALVAVAELAVLAFALLLKKCHGLCPHSDNATAMRAQRVQKNCGSLSSRASAICRK